MSAKQLARARSQVLPERPAKYWRIRTANLRGRSLRREVREVVDAQLFLDGRDLFHCFLESFLAEQAVLFFFELLAEILDLLGRHDFVQGGEEHGVLAGLVRAVHADERLADADHLLPRLVFPEP